MKKRTVILLTAGAMVLPAGCKGMGKASVSFVSGAHVLEYGIDLWDTEEEIHPDVMRYIRSAGGELSLDDSMFDAFLLGEQTLLINAANENSEVAEELKVLVLDTRAPVIELAAERCCISPGDEFDPSENVLSVIDPEEGDLMEMEKEETDAGLCFADAVEGWGFYAVIASDFDPNTEGEYPVTVIASDNHGNITEAEFTVVVSEEETSDNEEPVTVQGSVDQPAETEEEAAERFLEAQEYLCGAAGGTWEDACVFDYDDPDVYSEESSGEEESGEEPYEESEEDYWLDEEADPEVYDETDTEEYAEEDFEEAEGDPEQDCYDMGGVWYPEDGCAWPDEDAE